MRPISRRDAGKILLAGCAGALMPGIKLHGATRINSVIRGVQIGIQTVSFWDRSIDGCIDGIRKEGLGECELWDATMAPEAVENEDLTRWRLEAPISHFKQIRKRFDDVGVLLYAYNSSFPKVLTDEEMERVFLIGQAMGVKYITSTGSNVSAVPRVDKLAQKYKITVGFHNDQFSPDPDRFSSAESFTRAMKGASPYIAICFDAGHYTAAGGDPVAFINEHHESIIAIHLKDRRKNNGKGVPGTPTLHPDQGQGVPFGQGDTPIVGVLRLLRDKGWKIPAEIEVEYPRFQAGFEAFTEVKNSFEYCKKALES